MSETFYCHINNFKTIINELKEAQQNNNITQIQQLKQRINTFLTQCGAPVSDFDLEKILNTNKLEPAELAFLRNAPTMIIRSLQDGNIEQAEMLYTAVKDFINRNPKTTRMPEGFLGMLEKAFERNIDDTPQFKAKMTGHATTPLPFLKYRDKNEHIPTNLEIQERIKREKEEKKIE